MTFFSLLVFLSNSFDRLSLVYACCWRLYAKQFHIFFSPGFLFVSHSRKMNVVKIILGFGQKWVLFKLMSFENIQAFLMVNELPSPVRIAC